MISNKVKMLKNAIKENLAELKLLVFKLSNEDYKNKMEIFSGSSIGQHVRHILEFYVCLFQANEIACYDDRKRDLRIETDREFTTGLIDELIDRLNKIENDYPLKLKSNFSSIWENETFLQSSFYRELAYCLEHSIHHQALIKIAVKQLGVELLLTESFGVASSTLRYKKSA